MNKNVQIGQDTAIVDMLKKYGTVKNFHTKSSSSFGASIYVEYAKPVRHHFNFKEEAEVAIHNLTTLDQTGEKRKVLGDPSCDINFYYKKKFKNDNYNPMFNNQNNMNNNMNNMNNNMNNSMNNSNFTLTP